MSPGSGVRRTTTPLRVDGHLPLATTSATSLRSSTKRHSCALTYLLRQLFNQFCRVLVGVRVLVQLHDRHSRGELLQQRVEGGLHRGAIEVEEVLEKVLLLLAQAAEVGGQVLADLLRIRDGRQTRLLERGIE